jgi:hypothetical protein
MRGGKLHIIERYTAGGTRHFNGLKYSLSEYSKSYCYESRTKEKAG